MLFLIVTMQFRALYVVFIVKMMISALCLVFDCYHGDYRTLFSFSLLRLFLARSALFLIVTMMISALCVLFYCNDDD